MMKFEKLITTFVDMMEADGYTVMWVQKPDVHTYIIKLHDDDDQAFDYVHGAARFISEYYTRIDYTYSSKETDFLEITFKEDVGQKQ